MQYDFSCCDAAASRALERAGMTCLGSNDEAPDTGCHAHAARHTAWTLHELRVRDPPRLQMFRHARPDITAHCDQITANLTHEHIVG